MAEGAGSRRQGVGGLGRREAVYKRSLTSDAKEETSGQKLCNIQQRGKFGI